MMTKLPPPPTWRPYADETIARLKALPPSPDEPHWFNDPKWGQNASATEDRRTHLLFDELIKTRDYPHLPPDMIDDLRASGADPEATLITGESQPPQRLPAREVSIATRLAATFGSPKALNACLMKGAITFITGLDGRDIAAAERVLRFGMLPQGMQITGDPEKGTDDTALLLLHPDTSDKGVSEAALGRYLKQIDRAIDCGLPIIALLPDADDLPEALRQSGASTILRIAPLSAETLIAHLCHSHSATGRVDKTAVRAALPDDDRLVDLPFAALRLALRAPTAQDVALRIAAAIVPRKAMHAEPHLDEMAGDNPALTAARQLIADLRLWKAGEIAWSDLSRSMLIYGPPGTGKTWLARAMGNTAGIAFEEASFAGWQAAGHLGDMLREMRKSFAAARAKKPCILFIDEIDAVGSRGDNDSHGRSYRTQIVNAFLGEMDVISRDAGVIVLGACNDPLRIDPAVLRAGRFDLKLQMPLPDAAMIKGILRRHLVDEMAEEDLHSLATAAIGRSAADIDAGLRAARAQARHSGEPFSTATIRQHLGISTDRRQIAVDWRVAVHECGHAIVAAVLERGRVQRLLLTTAGGETHRVDTPNEGLLFDMLDEVACTLAGRAAEQLMLGDISAGAGGGTESDLAIATRIALSIEATLGLGADGPLWDGATDLVLLRHPDTRQHIRQRLEAAEHRAGLILAAREDQLRGMARALLHKREIYGAELEAWLSGVALQDDESGDHNDTSDGVAKSVSPPLSEHG